MRAPAVLALAGLVLLAPWLAPPGQAQPQPATSVAVNQCRQALSLIVSAVPEGGSRQIFGWFSLPANSDQALFATPGNPLQINPAQPVYIYATMADNSDTYDGTDLLVQWQGRTYNMQRRDLLQVDGTGPFTVRAVRFIC